jgi:hypothetical protein
MQMTDFDYYSVDDIDDCDEDQVHVLIFNGASGSYGWRWIYRETFADNGRQDMAHYGLANEYAE